MGDLVLIPGLGRSLEKGKATHSSILAWRISLSLSYFGGLLLHLCLFECDAQLDRIGSGLDFLSYINEVRELIKLCRNGGTTLSGCPCDDFQRVVLHFMKLLAVLLTFENPKKGLQLPLIHNYVHAL